MSANEYLRPIPHEFRHTIVVQPRFTDYDTFGHVNNNSYMQYFDLGKAAYYSDMLGHAVTPEILCAVIVHIDVDFLEPTTPDETVAVQTMTIAHGERSITIYQRIINPDTGHIKSQATSILAGFDPATQTAGPLNPALTAAILRLDPLS